jgi:hypothetical protein
VKRGNYRRKSTYPRSMRHYKGKCTRRMVQFKRPRHQRLWPLQRWLPIWRQYNRRILPGIHLQRDTLSG